jgi:hypothetical protein
MPRYVVSARKMAGGVFGGKQPTSNIARPVGKRQRSRLGVNLVTAFISAATVDGVRPMIGSRSSLLRSRRTYPKEQRKYDEDRQCKGPQEYERSQRHDLPSDRYPGRILARFKRTTAVTAALRGTLAAPSPALRSWPCRFGDQSSRLAEFGGLGMSFNICRGTRGSLAMFTAIGPSRAKADVSPKSSDINCRWVDIR